jgi:hypothetical protein
MLAGSPPHMADATGIWRESIFGFFLAAHRLLSPGGNSCLNTQELKIAYSLLNSASRSLSRYR